MESAFIAWLRERLPPHPLLRLGIGDDAAVLDMAGVDQCVMTVDALTDHVDFELSQVDPRRAGARRWPLTSAIWPRWLPGPWPA